MRISDWSSDVCSSDLNGDALVAAAIAGMGIVYQPTFIVADAVADGRLEILELDHPPFDLGNIYAVYPPNEHLPAKVRSEEHTSELQSLMRISYAVFCLKKKKTKRHKYNCRQEYN